MGTEALAYNIKDWSYQAGPCLQIHYKHNVMSSLSHQESQSLP